MSLRATESQREGGKFQTTWPCLNKPRLVSPMQTGLLQDVFYLLSFPENPCDIEIYPVALVIGAVCTVICVEVGRETSRHPVLESGEYIFYSFGQINFFLLQSTLECLKIGKFLYCGVLVFINRKNKKKEEEKEKRRRGGGKKRK